jgi:carboxyl-terminal processing protease
MEDQDSNLEFIPDQNSGHFKKNSYKKEFWPGYILHTALTVVLTATFVITALWLTGYVTLPDAVSFGDGGHNRMSVRKLQQVWNSLRHDYYTEPDQDKMLEYAAAGIAASVGDPYTVYYTKEEMVLFNERAEGSFHGIGVQVKRLENGRLEIVDIISGSPAEEAGAMTGDQIVSVDGTDVDDIADEDAVISMIKGQENTTVKVGFYRPSTDSVVVLDIERRVIKTENVKSHMISGDIGYIQIIMFDNEASEYFNTHLDKLLEGGAKSLIIDVRNNPGGNYDGVVKIADRLIGEGVIVYTEDRQGEREYRHSNPEKIDIPIRVLINGNSASASEILAGAVKDNNAGLLVGSKTFGKGLVQAIVTLVDGSGLKYTRSRYYTPNGICIQGDGIEPDIAAELPQELLGTDISGIPVERDTQLQKAIESLAG